MRMQVPLEAFVQQCRLVRHVIVGDTLEAAAAPHQVSWNWVRGHAGHAENERADALARRGQRDRGQDGV